jgi:hypothetical protein
MGAIAQASSCIADSHPNYTPSSLRPLDKSTVRTTLVIFAEHDN